ncbi:MAG: hypothetical protein LC754_05965 [Acidobacteria bacterium]|nr:hypothetical protein [Acidobacteriota bacterium]
MEETTQPFLTGDDPDATMIAPRFDEGEADTARPVVPLGVVASGAPEAFNGAAPYAARRNVPRRSWPLSLVLISALAGSVLGGVGLYFYQSRDNTNTPSVETQESATSPVEVAQPSPTNAPEREVEHVALPPQPSVSSEQPAPASSSSDDERAGDLRKHRDEDERKTAAETRRAAETDERDGTVKRGKKGERDDEAAQRQERPRRIGDNPTSSPDPNKDASDEAIARRVGTIFDPEGRRVRRPRPRREDVQRAVDRVRGIFEGQPPQ